MKDWITILTFTYPTQAHLAKSKLESEDIEVFLKDELTAQMNNFYSNAIDGVKLQVRENDSKRAIEILKACGYIKEEEHSTNNFILGLDRFSSKIPILGKTVLEFRLIVLIAIVILIIAFSVIFITSPTIEEKLTESRWCIENVIFQGKKYRPNTTGLIIQFNNGCSERVFFRKNGQVYFPGFNSRKIRANWKLDNERMLIYNSDTLTNVFNGEYILNISHNSLKMVSENTTIVGYPNSLL